MRAARFVVGSLVAVSLAVLSPPSARADWDVAEDPAPASPVPTTAPTTVQAPPGSAGVTVVAPTAQGGTVTATGCKTVTVAGSPTQTEVVCPPYQPLTPEPQVVYVYRDPPPRFRRDVGRSVALPLSAVGHALGSLVAGAMYVDAAERDHRRCLAEHRTPREVSSGSYTYTTYDYDAARDQCGSSGAIGPLIGYMAVMAITPGIPRLVVGDTKGFLTWGAVIAGTITFAKIVDMLDENARGVGAGGILIGFVGAGTLGIIELTQTPHREDLEKKSGVDSVAIAPIRDVRGMHGWSMGLAGRF